MANLAIRGHATRGSEVIALLEMLGGINKYNLRGNEDKWYVLNGKQIQHSDLLFTEKGFTLEEFLEKFPYKVWDKVSSKYLKNYKIEKIEWEYINNRVIYKLQGMGWYDVNELQPYKEETMDRKFNVEEYLKVWEETEKGLEVVVNDKFELKEDNGKFYIIKKQLQHPKTYEECCEILNIHPKPYFTYTWNIQDANVDKALTRYHDNLLNKLDNLRILLICRDAYWKIAGDWKPDWNNISDKHCICVVGGDIWLKECQTRQVNLAFPTVEMRDAFYENFKELIENCKELL